MSDLRSRIVERIANVDEQYAVSPLRGDYEIDSLARFGGSDLRPAAVLIPIVEHHDGMTVLLTQRTDHLDHHPGQISFPGGRMEPHDRSPADTALRETEEEIGLDREFVQVVGYLDTYETVTGFEITPVVGLVRPGFTLNLDAFEVAEAFEVPFSFLMDANNHERHSREFRGNTRHFYVMPYEERYIWGATAGMLVNLSRKLGL